MALAESASALARQRRRSWTGTGARIAAAGEGDGVAGRPGLGASGGCRGARASWSRSAGAARMSSGRWRRSPSELEAVVRRRRAVRRRGSGCGRCATRPSWRPGRGAVAAAGRDARRGCSRRCARRSSGSRGGDRAEPMLAEAPMRRLATGIGDGGAGESSTGMVEVEVGPLTDFSQLVGFEDAAGGIAATSEISVKRFARGPGDAGDAAGRAGRAAARARGAVAVRVQGPRTALRPAGARGRRRRA